MTQLSPELPIDTSHVLVPFHCPRCKAVNKVHLVTLSRAGAMPCDGCGTRLKSGDVMRALIDGRNREAAGPDGRPSKREAAYGSRWGRK